MRLSAQQDDAMVQVSRWLKSSDQVFRLFGYAGTGKTTIARELASEVQSAGGLVLYSAFTGKAASVLRSKGCADASTLHSLLYKASETDETKLQELHRRIKEVDASLSDEQTDEDDIDRLHAERRRLVKLFKEERKRTAGPIFGLNEASIVHEASLVVLDEVSMVNSELGRDLLSFGKKVLVLGDPAQLPPVKGAGFFMQDNPNVLLTEIHRQARDNPILRYATMAREGRTIPYGDEGAARKIRKKQTNIAELAAEGGQLLIGKNETRRKVNRGVREQLGFHSTYPSAGEKLVCLRNDKEIGVLNGVLCTAASEARYDDEEEGLVIDLEYEGNLIPMVPLDPAEFDIYDNPEMADEVAMRSGWDKRKMLQMDFGYALTVHKSQGSEWPVVTLCDDGFGVGMRGRLREQWLYTAITRAQDKITIIS